MREIIVGLALGHSKFFTVLFISASSWVYPLLRYFAEIEPEYRLSFFEILFEYDEVWFKLMVCLLSNCLFEIVGEIVESRVHSDVVIEVKNGCLQSSNKFNVD